MKLKWSLIELQRYQDEVLMLDGEVDLTNSLKKRKTDLIEVSPIIVQGTLSAENFERYYVDLELKVTLTLPSTRTLEEVDYNLTTMLSEVYLAPDVDSKDPEILDELEDELVFSLENDFIDLRKPIEDTILASIPMKILSQKEEDSKDLPSGSGWEVRLEEDSQNLEDESENPAESPFNVLKDLDLFNDKDEKSGH